MALVEHARRIWNERDMFCGNCGVFALEMARRLQAVGHDGMEIVLFHDRRGEDVIAEDILASETDVYHVALRVDGQLFDGDGAVTEAHIIEQLAIDPPPGVMAAPFDDEMIEHCIVHCTDIKRSRSFYAIRFDAVVLHGAMQAQEPVP